MTPYYDHKGITIYHGDCLDILPYLEPVDIVLTDPPYSEKTHNGARTTEYRGIKDGGKKAISFDSVNSDFLRGAFSLCSVNFWLISFIDWHHILPLELKPPKNLEFIRFGVWTKKNPIPQLTADRPGTGWEAIAIFHPYKKKKWNGGSKAAVWHFGTSRYGYFGPSNHPAEKPISLIVQLLRDFAQATNVILDPFMGSGTTLVAAKQLGRRAIGIEIEEKYCEIAVRRLAQEMLPFK